MRIRELIELLQKEDPEDLVVLSKDGEGNTFSPFSDLSRKMYVPDTTWRGETYLRSPLTEEQIAEGFVEGDDTTDDPKAVRCVVLWPVN